MAWFITGDKVSFALWLHRIYGRLKDSSNPEKESTWYPCAIESLLFETISRKVLCYGLKGYRNRRSRGLAEELSAGVE